MDDKEINKKLRLKTVYNFLVYFFQNFFCFSILRGEVDKIG